MTSIARQRFNITLPNSTVNLIKRAVPKGNRSQLIDIALKYYIQSVGREALRRRLKEGAINQAAESLQMAADWFALDEEAWLKTEK